MVDNERFLRLPDVEKMTGLRRSTIYDLMTRDEFPNRRRVGPKIVIWLESEVRSWMAAKIGEHGTARSA